MEEVLMIPRRELPQLMQFYKSQIMENPLLEKAAQLSVQQHQLLTDPAISDSVASAQLKPLGRQIHFLKTELKKGTPEEDEPPPEVTPLPTKTDKKKRAPRKTLVEQLRPLPSWEDWAEPRQKRSRKSPSFRLNFIYLVISTQDLVQN